MDIHQVAGEIARTVSGSGLKLTEAPRAAGIPGVVEKAAPNPLKSPRVAGVIESADTALKEADLITSGNEK